MMQTQETVKRRFSGTYLYEKTRKFLRETDFINKGHQEMARTIEELGFGYYFWTPRGGRDVIRGDISGEIMLSSF